MPGGQASLTVLGPQCGSVSWQVHTRGVLKVNMNEKSITRHLSSPKFGLSTPQQPRRLSIQENLSQLTKSLSSLRLTPSKSSGEGWNLFGVMVDKEVMEKLLIDHYEDSSVKVIN